MSVVEIEAVDDAQSLQILDGDLDELAFAQALEADVIALDIETTGLDWRCDEIGVVQLHVEDTTYVIRINGCTPNHLKAVIEDARVRKVLHHAMFDLRFLARRWDVTPANVACTKIASKLAEPEAPKKEHSLAPLVKRYLGVSLDKTEQTSEWTKELSDAQVRYAADDVRYLVPLFRRLDEKLREVGRDGLRDRCFAQLPTQVELEVGEFPDVFSY
jgi:ribonuclease D